MEHLAPGFIQALARYGYVVILVIMVVEEAGVPLPIPGDGLLLFAGYLASTGALNLAGSLATVVVGAMVGATILYWLARRGGRRLVLRYGRFLKLDERRLDQLRRLFDRLGYAGPGVARLVPGLRVYTSALAGLADIRYPIFLTNVAWSCTVWGLVFLLLGDYFGAYWSNYTRFSDRLFYPSVLAVGMLVGGYLWVRSRRRRKSA